MTPAEQLAAARSNVVGPYVPATEALLVGWVGPINIAREAGDPPSAYLCGVWLSNAAEIIGERIGYGVSDEYGNPDYARIFLDLRRPEVRDRLVRRGAPAWARDVAPALWVWVTSGKVPTMLGRPHGSYRYAAVGEVLSAYRLSPATRGWEVFVGGAFTEGPETGPEGMACADLAALAAGCILEEADGWLLPLPDGGIGFWPKP